MWANRFFAAQYIENCALLPLIHFSVFAVKSLFVNNFIFVIFTMSHLCHRFFWRFACLLLSADLRFFPRPRPIIPDSKPPLNAAMAMANPFSEKLSGLPVARPISHARPKESSAVNTALGRGASLPLAASLPPTKTATPNVAGTQTLHAGTGKYPFTVSKAPNAVSNKNTNHVQATPNHVCFPSRFPKDMKKTSPDRFSSKRMRERYFLCRNYSSVFSSAASSAADSSTFSTTSSVFLTGFLPR